MANAANNIQQIDVQNISVVNPATKSVDATGATGTLYGNRPNYTCLFVRQPAIVKPLVQGKAYSFNMTDANGNNVLGVTLKYTDANGPGGSLIFGNPAG